MTEGTYEERLSPAVTLPSGLLLVGLGVFVSFAGLGPPGSWVVSSLIVLSIGTVMVVARVLAPRVTIVDHELRWCRRRHTVVLDLAELAVVETDWILGSGWEVTLRWSDGGELVLPVDRSTRALRRRLGQVITTTSARFGSIRAREVLFV